MPMHCFFFSQPPLVSSLTLPWIIARFLDQFYTFSLAHRRVIRDFTLPRFECIGIQFFNLHTHTCEWLAGHHATPEVTHTHTHTKHTHTHTHTHTLHIPREAEDFSSGDRHFKHAPLPTYLSYLSPKGLYW